MLDAIPERGNDRENGKRKYLAGNATRGKKRCGAGGMGATQCLSNGQPRTITSFFRALVPAALAAIEPFNVLERGDVVDVAVLAHAHESGESEGVS